MKILCLHGYTQNGNLFARKASGVRKALAKAGHELFFVSAPLKVDVSDLPFEPPSDAGDMDMRAWWVINEADPKVYDLKEAFATVDRAIKDDGPFDGLLAFSQGAGLAAILTKYLPTQGHPPFKFCIMYSGFVLKAPFHQHFYAEPKFSTPSLHVMGTLDTVVAENRSMALFDAWEQDKRQVLKHPGGHFVPSTKPMVRSIVEFVESVAKDEADASAGATPAKPNDDDDWSQFDSLGGEKK